MSRYFISDTHFGHARIIELANRPFKNVQQMNEVLIDNWNSTVRPDDIIFHLGDVALGPWVEWDSILTRLNGYKILVVGNHDRVFKGMSSKQNERFAPLYAGWFNEVHDAMSIRVGEDLVRLSHFPYDGDSHGEERHREFRPRDDGRTLIHGHTHSSDVVTRSSAGTMQIHVGVDAWDFIPVHEDEIVSLIKGEQ